MQSVAKLSEAGNIYKLNDRRNAEEAQDSDPPGDIAKLSAGGTPGNKERDALSTSWPVEPEAGSRDAHGEPGAPSSGPDDALAWLKIIQNATADLTADIRSSRGEGFARFPENEAAPGSSKPAAFRGDFAGRAGFHDETRHDDFSAERQLAQKLSYRYSEPRSAPPQTLWSAVMPYVAATGVFAFLAGSAAVYLLFGQSSPDVKSRMAPPATETRGETLPALSNQQSPKKSGAQRVAPSAETVNSRGSSAEEVQQKPAPEAAGDRQPKSWADTVETFKQYVKPEQK